MEYLVDTDWAIACLRKDVETMRRLGSFLPDGVGMSVISLAELCDAVAGLPAAVASGRDLRLFLDLVQVMPLSEAACRTFGEERARLRRDERRRPDRTGISGRHGRGHL